MTRKSIARWLGSSLVATAAATGCQHVDSPRVAQSSPRPQVIMLPQNPSASGKFASGPMGSPAAASNSYGGGQMPPGHATAAASSQAPSATPVALEAPKQEIPAAPTVAPAAETATLAAPSPGSAKMETPPAAAENSLPDPAELRTASAPSPGPAGQSSGIRLIRTQDPPAEPIPGEQAPRRRSFVDSTANPCFNHSEDYHSLTGQLQRSHLSKGWRLRYASVDESDPYGGSVTLLEDDRLNELKHGQYVRVRGRFLNPDDHGIAPPYQVDSIQPLEAVK